MPDATGLAIGVELPRSCDAAIAAATCVDPATTRASALTTRLWPLPISTLIVVYTGAVFLAGVWALACARVPFWWFWIFLAAAVAAGLSDGLETMSLEDFLHTATCDGGEGPIAMVRIAAQVKFIGWLAAFAASAIAWGAMVRGRFGGDGGASSYPSTTWMKFEDLILAEGLSIFSADGSRKESTPKIDGAREPWVRFREADVVGLALSGGGIRSATFNLGLLQGLNRLNLLPLFDYVASVSGGGYIAGFWSAWLNRRKGDPARFPCLPPETTMPSSLTPPREPRPIRHLREFSRFLAPRVGFFEAEMWYGIVAVLAGLLPAMMAALSLLGLLLIVWLGLTFSLACRSPWAAATTAFMLTYPPLLLIEPYWAKFAGLSTDDQKTKKWTYHLAALLAAVLTVGAHYALPFVYDWWDLSAQGSPHARWSIYNGAWTSVWRRDAGAYDAWWRLVGIDGASQSWFFSPRLLDPALVWFAVAIAMLLLRAVLSVRLGAGEKRRARAPAFDRAVMRVLGSGILWLLFATLWHVSVNLPHAWALTFATATTGGLFALLRNWIGMALRDRPQGSGKDRLKPYLPQVLAYATVGLAFVSVGVILIQNCESDWMSWYIAAFVMTTSAGAMLLFDPAELGLHSFYRDRIARAYLGASNPVAIDDCTDRNQQTDPRLDDDLPIAKLCQRPLHLVCCAANDLSGDPIDTLMRGARSAVLSCNGVSMGTASISTVATLGAAVTASAAAFNSSMGSVSIQLGPAVGFLMCALNLRLGLWVRNPENLEARDTLPVPARPFPGLLFYKEMFGLTDASDKAPEIHLSDGAHFDNLALYELVRRHCRYILLSDCGEDPEVAFDDFGNAARRIREDFGVDIDIDLDPLRLGADKRSRAHVVVGTIHYGDFDKGILVYVKPALTGDEPPDILQYHTRNEQFPHEPTADQFYDEAQWESYRRLGEHTASVAFGFVNNLPENKRADPEANGRRPPEADAVFEDIRQTYAPIPAGLADRALQMTTSIGALEATLLKDNRIGFLGEIFPEVAFVSIEKKAGTEEEKGETEKAKDRSDAASMPSSTEHFHDLVCLLQVTQALENVFIACRLDTYWNHPINMGWTNTFARWVTSPTFRMWWPLLAPMYGSDFGSFLQESFGVISQGRPKGASGTITEVADVTTDAGIAAEWWRSRQSSVPTVDRKARTFAYTVTLVHPDKNITCDVQVALAFIVIEKGTASWSCDHFFVPPSLWGAGIGGRFMHALIDRFQTQKEAHTCKVRVEMPDERSDDTARINRVNFVEFYKRHRFRLEEPNPKPGDPRSYVDLSRRFNP